MRAGTGLIVAAASVAAATARAQEAAPATPATMVDPAAWFGVDNYPPAAIRAGEQGRVVVRVTVSAAGRPTRCDVDVSIGSPLLEQGTCAIVMERGQFAPARDAKGRAIASVLTLPVRWVLPEGASADDPAERRESSQPGRFRLVWHVAADGHVASCQKGLDDRLEAATSAECGDAAPLVAQARQLGMAGALRGELEVLTSHGDMVPAAVLPAAPARQLRRSVARFTVDAEGRPHDCSIAMTGIDDGPATDPLPPTPCARDARFVPVLGPDRAPRAQRLVVVTRFLVVPTPN